MKFEITPAIASELDQKLVVREIDDAGCAHLVIKVPDMQKYAEADIGLEVNRNEDKSILISLLIYDIPTEPVSYDLRFEPEDQHDLRFLRSFVDSAMFRLFPCSKTDAGWVTGEMESFKVPANMLLKLKHFSLDWPEVSAVKEEVTPEPQAVETSDAPATANSAESKFDSRDKVIRKLKEQNQALRAQLQEKDKRIIELEDLFAEVKSKGRNYRLANEKKSWWKVF